LLTDALLRSERVRAYDATACSIEGFAMLALSRQLPISGARLLGAAERIRERANRPLAPIEQPDHRRMVASLRAALHDENFHAAWTQGRAMTIEEVRAEAMNCSLDDAHRRVSLLRMANDEA
jgi:hypothetical protein